MQLSPTTFLHFAWLPFCLGVQALPAQDLLWSEFEIGSERKGFLPIELTVSDSPELVLGLQTSPDLQSWQDNADSWVVLERLDSGFQRVGFLAPPDADLASSFMRVRIGLNTPPLAGDDRIMLTETSKERRLPIFDNDFDPDGDAVVLVEYREPDHGTLQQREGDLFYTPLANFSGSDRFEYSIRDSHGAVATGTVTLLVPDQDDTDADELPNQWEIQHGLNPNDPSDALTDPDADGFPNLYEFYHHSDPTDHYHRPTPTQVVNTTSQIEQSLLIAEPFEIIAIAAGRYQGGDWELPGPNHPVMLVAQSGPGTSIINLDRGDSRRAFNFDAQQDRRSAISGLTIRDGFRALGAGMRFVDDSAATIIDCTFENCQSENSGGAVYVRDSTPSFLRCTFNGNQAGSFAGAVYATGTHARAAFYQCTFTDNHAKTDGGALYFTDEASADIQHCRFHLNEANNNGGAVAFNAGSKGQVTRSFFTHNVSGSHGGAIACRISAHPVVSHCVVARNNSQGRGGGLYAGNEAFPTLVHCTLTDNQAESGGGVYHFLTSPVQIRHCILWDNEPQQLLANGGEDIANSIIRGGREGNDNLASDPLLIPDDVARYRLQAESPARDQAPASTGTDIDGEDRLTHADLGADEFVDADLDGLPDHWERQVGLDPNIDDAQLDLDQDGTINLTAYLKGTDPAANLPTTISIGGEIQATNTAPIRILLVAAPDTWQAFAATSATPSQPTFQFDRVPRRQTLWARAYHDLNGNHHREPCEPITGSQALDTKASIIGLTLTLPPPDHQPPILSGVPSDLTVTRIEDIPSIAQVTAQDQGQTVEVFVQESIFGPATPNQIHRHWKAHDICGNTATASQTISVVGPEQDKIGVFLTSFEPGQGYAPGPLSGQDGWTTSSNAGVQITNVDPSQRKQYSLSLTEPRAQAQRPFTAGEATTIDLTFALYLEAATGLPPSPDTFTQEASAIVSYDAARGLVALNGDGQGGGEWVVIPDSLLPNQWVQIRILKHDKTAQWSLDVNGKRVHSGLGYKDRSRTGLSRLRITNGDDGTASIDDLILTHQ